MVVGRSDDAWGDDDDDDDENDGEEDKEGMEPRLLDQERSDGVMEACWLEASKEAVGLDS